MVYKIKMRSGNRQGETSDHRTGLTLIRWEEMKKEWVGNASDYSATLWKSQPAQLGTPEQRVLIRGTPHWAEMALVSLLCSEIGWVGYVLRWNDAKISQKCYSWRLLSDSTPHSRFSLKRKAERHLHGCHRHYGPISINPAKCKFGNHPGSINCNKVNNAILC